MGEELSLKRALTTKDLAVYGMCFMIPVAPFAWYGTLVEGAMGMVALGYAIALVAMLFTGFSYASMANRFPMGGSVYRYVQQSTTPALGFLGGWGMMLSYFFLPAVCYCVGATFVAALTPSIPAWVWYVIFILVTGVVALLGIEGSSTVSWILFGIQIVGIAIFAVIVFMKVAKGELSINFNGFKNPYEPFNMHGVLGATVVVVLSYVGFDAISTLADETVKPEKMIGKAVILSIVLMGVLFSFMAWLCAVCVPDYRTLTMDESAVLQIFQTIGGSKLMVLECAIIVVAFGLSCGLECLIASTRVIYSMASDGIFPKVFAKVSKRQVPAVAIVFMMVVSLIQCVVMGLNIIAVITSFGSLIGFMAVNLAVVWKLFIKEKDKTAKGFIKFVVSPLIGFGVCLFIFVNSDPFCLKFGLVWMIIGFLWLLYITRGFKKPCPTLEDI